MDEKGGLMCNSLEKAEDAPLLLFRVPMTKENTGGANVSFRHGSARAVDLLGKACKGKSGNPPPPTAMSAWSVKTRHAPCRHSRGTRAKCLNTMTGREMNPPPPPP